MITHLACAFSPCYHPQVFEPKLPSEAGHLGLCRHGGLSRVFVGCQVLGICAVGQRRRDKCSRGFGALIRVYPPISTLQMIT